MIGDVAFLIPNPGALVRDPRTRDPLAAEGATKPMNGPDGRYWRRRLRDGVVRIGKPAAVPKVKKKTRREED